MRLLSSATNLANKGLRDCYKSLITFLAWDWGSDKRQKAKSGQSGKSAPPRGAAVGGWKDPNRSRTRQQPYENGTIFEVIDEDPDGNVVVKTNMRLFETIAFTEQLNQDTYGDDATFEAGFSEVQKDGTVHIEMNKRMPPEKASAGKVQDASSE